MSISIKEEPSVIQILQYHGVKVPKSIMNGNKMLEATTKIKSISENILNGFDDDQRDWLKEQLTDLENACSDMACIELDEYFKQGFILGFKLAQEIKIE